MEKADFLYFELEAPNGINLIMFRDSNVTFFCKKSEKIKVHFSVINLLMLQNKVIALSTGSLPIELHTKHVFSENANKSKTHPNFCLNLQRMFIENSRVYVSNFGGLDFCKLNS